MSPERIKIVAETNDSVFVRQDIKKTHYTRRAFLGTAIATVGTVVIDLKFFNASLTKRLIRETLKKISITSPEKDKLIETGPQLLSSIDLAVNLPMGEIDLDVSNLYEIVPNLDIAENKYLPVENGVRRLKFGQIITYTTHWPGGSQYRHNALDIEGKKNAPVYSPAEGIVQWVGPIYRTDAQGNQVVIIYYPEFNFCTSYGHNNKALVQIGQKVQKGTPLALLGDQGYSTPGYFHIHWEVWQNAKFTGNWQNPWTGGEPVNPEIFLNLLNK